MNGRNGGVAYAVLTVGNGGSKLLIFDLRLISTPSIGPAEGLGEHPLASWLCYLGQCSPRSCIRYGSAGLWSSHRLDRFHSQQCVLAALNVDPGILLLALPADVLKPLSSGE
jgi:hypothetical protein